MADFGAFEIVAGLLGTSATGVIGYTASKVVSLHREVGEIKTMVTDHVAREDTDRASLQKDLSEIRERMPNGELHEALEILKGLKNRPRLGSTSRSTKPVRKAR